MTNENEVWVHTGEAAKITGYSREYLTKLARKLAAQPEAERSLKVRKHFERHQFWLPDLLAYTEEHGPQRKRKLTA